MLPVPIEGGVDLSSCGRADAQLTHLSELAKQGCVNLRPRLARCGGDIRFCFTAIEFGGEAGGYRRGGGGIETIPEPTHQFDAVLGGQSINLNCARSHN